MTNKELKKINSTMRALGKGTALYLDNLAVGGIIKQSELDKNSGLIIDEFELFEISMEAKQNYEKRLLQNTWNKVKLNKRSN